MTGSRGHGTTGHPIALGTDEYFFLGDNSASSFDSRYWGAVREEALIGPVSWIFWPPSHWRWFGR